MNEFEKMDKLIDSLTKEDLHRVVTEEEFKEMLEEYGIDG